jgi:hypothetical protein
LARVGFAGSLAAIRMNNADKESSSPARSPATSPTSPRAWQAIVLSALAGGLGWGIRGQYGHETGAMMAGALVGLTLVFLFCPGAPGLSAARAVAWCTIAIGFGGSMTYAQTIGLTHDAAMIGNAPALRWGMLGLALKGGIWIGFAGVFLGMGLSGVRYRPRELLALMAVLGALYFAGGWWLNQPFDPAHRILPRIYFSADWRWRPDAVLKPRREDWGGLLLALIGLIGYAGGWRRDRLARHLAGWAVLGGMVGFPLGQCLQAYHAWHQDAFRQGWWAGLDPLINWWNMMETTFGAVMGGTIGLGLWLNRRHIAIAKDPNVSLAAPWEWVLVGVHMVLLTISEFVPVRDVSQVVDIGLLMGIIPIVAVAGGRWWPYLLALPITLFPIAGKTIRQLCYEEQALAPWAGWVGYGVVPMALAVWAAIGFARQAPGTLAGGTFARRALALNAWLYFGLNYAFFHYPWPWTTWTARTPNALIYTLCALGLTGASIWIHRRARTCST